MSGAYVNDYERDPYSNDDPSSAVLSPFARMLQNRYPEMFSKPPTPTPGPGPGGYPQPIPTPTPTQIPPGLMQQSADPWGTYGQMGVNEPYLSNINNRFGWSSQGLAYPTQLQATPTWYNPPIVYPKVVQPPLNPVITPTTGK